MIDTRKGLMRENVEKYDFIGPSHCSFVVFVNMYVILVLRNVLGL